MVLNKTETLRNAQQLINQGRLSAAIALYQKIVDTDSSDLATLSRLSDLYIKSGRIPEATDHFLRVAENYMQSGSAISAAYILNKVLKLDPVNATAHSNLGKMYLTEGKVDRAHSHFIEAGAAYWRKAESRAAVEMNMQALAIMPDSQEAKAALDLIQKEVEKPEPPPPPEPVYVELEPILISVPDDSEPACATQATPDSQVKHEPPPDSSDSPLQQESQLGLDDDEVFDHLTRAELLVGYGQVDSGIALLRNALQRSPDNIEIRAKLKDIYLRSEMTDRASEECINIAGIYAGQGKTSLAQEYIIRARLLSNSVVPIGALAFWQKHEVNKIEEAQETGLEWSLLPGQPVSLM
jgi:tetratricopeptide (TPR) repeat protein